MREEARGRGGEIGLCAFCRKPAFSSSEEKVKRIKKLREANNTHAFCNFSGCHKDGIMGVSQDMTKANELMLKAGELGHAGAYCCLGYSYEYGKGVEMNKKKAQHYYELSAMNGDVLARYNLGCLDKRAGNELRAYKHFILAAKAGKKDSVDQVKEAFMKRIITKDEYAITLRACQQRQEEMKSDDRDKAEKFYQRDSSSRAGSDR